MATFKELQDQVLHRVIDTPDSVQSEVPNLVNAAIRKLMVAHNFKVMEATAQFTTSPASHTLGSLPTGWKEPRDEAPFLVDAAGRVIELKWLPNETDVLRQYSYSWAEDKGRPEALVLSEQDEDGNGEIKVYPFPDDQSDHMDGNYRVHVPHWRFLPALSADSDSNWFTVNAAEYIAADATAEAFYLDWDEKRAEMWEDRAWGPAYRLRGLIGGFAARAIRLDKHGRIATTNTLIPRRDVYAHRDQTRM